MTDGDRRTVIITGASDGVGAAAARRLGGDVDLIVVGRSPEKTAKVAADSGARAALTADFSNLDDVRRLAGDLAAAAPRIDVLMNNAGGLFDPSRPTADGWEPNAQINHLAPFLLTHLLRDRLTADGGALVINTSSVGNLAGRVRPHNLTRLRPGWQYFLAYGSSKLMNILFTRGIAARWAGDGIVSVAVHPGPVASNFGHDSRSVGFLYRSPLTPYVMITPDQAAGPFVDLIGRGADPGLNGVYFSQHRPNGFTNPQARSSTVTDELWETSARLVGV